MVSHLVVVVVPASSCHGYNRTSTSMFRSDSGYKWSSKLLLGIFWLIKRNVRSLKLVCKNDNDKPDQFSNSIIGMMASLARVHAAILYSMNKFCDCQPSYCQWIFKSNITWHETRSSKIKDMKQSIFKCLSNLLVDAFLIFFRIIICMIVVIYTLDAPNDFPLNENWTCLVMWYMYP